MHRLILPRWDNPWWVGPELNKHSALCRTFWPNSLIMLFPPDFPLLGITRYRATSNVNSKYLGSKLFYGFLRPKGTALTLHCLFLRITAVSTRQETKIIQSLLSKIQEEAVPRSTDQRVRQPEGQRNLRGLSLPTSLLPTVSGPWTGEVKPQRRSWPAEQFCFM